MNYAAENNIYPVKPKFFSYQLDTVVVKKYTNLRTLASVLQIPFGEVQFLNPRFEKHHTSNKDGLPLILPIEKIGIFLTNQESIYELDKPKVNDAYANQGEIMKDVRRVHKVRRGETLEE